MKNKTLCVIQARMGSTRLPGKVLLKVKGVPLLEYEIRRVKQAKKVRKIVVAATDKKEDDKIEAMCRKINIDCFRGSENDVLDRFYRCSLRYPAYDNIMRLTGDCPLVDPKIIDQVIVFFEKGKYDFANNAETGRETFPDGIDIEIFKRSALHIAAKEAKLKSEREHVVPYMINSSKFKQGYLSAEYDFSHIRLTVDNQEDFEVVKFLISSSKAEDGYMHYISVLTKNPRVMLGNTHLKRNEGFLKSLQEDGEYLN